MLSSLVPGLVHLQLPSQAAAEKEFLVMRSKFPKDECLGDVRSSPLHRRLLSVRSKRSMARSDHPLLL